MEKQLMSKRQAIQELTEKKMVDRPERERKMVEEALIQIFEEGKLPKDALKLTEEMIDVFYGQAYRLYESGKYKDSLGLFHLLRFLNELDPKFSMGLGACYQMMKNYPYAVQAYMMCGFLDTESPIPYYHMSDCFIQMHHYQSAVVALEITIQRTKRSPNYEPIRERAEMTLKSLKKDYPKEIEGTKKNVA